eukprot:6684543-Prymnesium_polylepis.1
MLRGGGGGGGSDPERNRASSELTASCFSSAQCAFGCAGVSGCQNACRAHRAGCILVPRLETVRTSSLGQTDAGGSARVTLVDLVGSMFYSVEVPAARRNAASGESNARRRANRCSERTCCDVSLWPTGCCVHAPHTAGTRPHFTAVEGNEAVKGTPHVTDTMVPVPWCRISIHCIDLWTRSTDGQDLGSER